MYYLARRKFFYHIKYTRRQVTMPPSSPASSLSTQELFEQGLTFIGFDSSRQNCSNELSERRFRAHYGVDAAAIKALIADLEKVKPVIPKSLFMAICWLKIYDLEEVMAGRWGYGEKYCRETVRDYLKRIQKLKKDKITFSDLNPDCKFLVGVDTVHVRS